MREVLFVRETDDLALATSHLVQSSSASRFTAGAFAFFIFSQWGERPARGRVCFAQKLRDENGRVATQQPQRGGTTGSPRPIRTRCRLGKCRSWRCSSVTSVIRR